LFCLLKALHPLTYQATFGKDKPYASTTPSLPATALAYFTSGNNLKRVPGWENKELAQTKN